MHKLKNSYIDRMVDAQLTSCEIDFILYIAQYQLTDGTVQSVYYKDITQAIDISIQKFYDILDSLKKKQLISVEKINRADWVVYLLGNDFSGEDFHAGYLNVAAKDFSNEKFRSMKAGSKLLFLYLQRFINGKHMLVQNFYDELSQVFHVTAKSLQIYLKELKDNFYLFISKKRNKAYHYEMMMKNSTVLDIKKHLRPTEKQGVYENFSNLLKVNYKKQLPNESIDQVIDDIVGLADTQRGGRGHRGFLRTLQQAVEDSITLQKKEGKAKPVLNAALVNKCLTRLLEVNKTMLNSITFP